MCTVPSVGEIIGVHLCGPQVMYTCMSVATKRHTIAL